MSKITDAATVYVVGQSVDKTEVIALWADIVRTFETVNLMAASAALTLSEIVHTSDGRNWKVVPAGTGINDGINYIDLLTLQAELIVDAGAGGSLVGVDDKDVDYMAIKSDGGSVINFTEAATLSFDTLLNLGVGWSVHAVAFGGDVPVDGNVNGTPDFVLYEGQSATFIMNETGIVVAGNDRALTDAEVLAGTSTKFGLVNPKQLSRSRPTFIVRDEKANGTNGQALNSTVWETRDINKVEANTLVGASLVSNQITLPAGAREWRIDVPAIQVNGHRAALYDVTNSVFLDEGSIEHSHSSDVTASLSRIVGGKTLVQPTVVEIRHIVDTTAAAGGGKGTSINGDTLPNVFTTAQFW